MAYDDPIAPNYLVVNQVYQHIRLNQMVKVVAVNGQEVSYLTMGASTPRTEKAPPIKLLPWYTTEAERSNRKRFDSVDILVVDPESPSQRGLF